MHMMVSRPEQWVKPMAAAGANQYTFHLEATTNPGNLIKEIRESGMKVRRGDIHIRNFRSGRASLKRLTIQAMRALRLPDNTVSAFCR